MSSTTPAPAPAAPAPTLYKYCKNPAKYKDQLTDDVRSRYTELCAMIEKAKAEEAAANTSGARAKKFGTTFGTMIASLPYLLTIGQLTDPGQMTLLIATSRLWGFGLQAHGPFWQKHATQLWSNIAKDFGNVGSKIAGRIQSGATKVIPKGAAPLLRQGTGRFILTNSALRGSIQRGFVTTVNGMVRNVGRGSVRVFLGMLRLVAASGATAMFGIARLFAALNIAFMASFVLMMVAMVVDSIDPCDLNKSMDASTIVQYSEAFDKQFKESILLPETYFVNVNQEMQFIHKWPIDIRIEKLFPIWPDNIPGDEKDDPTIKKTLETKRLAEFGISEERKLELLQLKMEFEIMYKFNLKYNAYGQPIVFPEEFDPPELTPEAMTVLGNQFVSQFTNNNPIVSRWLNKYSPLILVGIAVILFLIMKYV